MSYGQNPYPPQNQPPFGGAPYGPPGSQGSAPWGPGGQGQRPAGAPAGWQQPGQPGYGGQPPQGWPQGAPQPGAPQGAPQGPAGQQPGQWGPGQGPAAPVPATPVPEPEPRRATFRTRDLLVATTEVLAGHEIAEVLGEVVGTVTRPRQLRPAPDLAALLTQTRQDAIDAAVAMAQQAGAHALVGLRFDGGKVNDQTSEVTAYATAVKLVGGNPLEADDNPFTTGGSAVDVAAPEHDPRPAPEAAPAAEPEGASGAEPEGALPAEPESAARRSASQHGEDQPGPNFDAQPRPDGQGPQEQQG